MSEALIELLFWCVVFVALFFGLRKLQSRKKARDQVKTASQQEVRRAADGSGDRHWDTQGNNDDRR